MAINKTAVIGDLLISCEVLNEAERKLAVQRERKNVAEKLSDDKKRANFKTACEGDPDCQKTVVELAKSASIAEDELEKGPRFVKAVRQLIAANVINRFDEKEFDHVYELLNAFQAIGRGEGIVGTFENEGISKKKLEAIRATYSSSPAVDLNKLPDEKWIADSKVNITKETQAVTSMLKCFVTATAQAMEEHPKGTSINPVHFVPWINPSTRWRFG